MNGVGEEAVRSSAFPFQPQKIRLLTKNIFIQGKCLFPLSFAASVSARNQFPPHLSLLFLKKRERRILLKLQGPEEDRTEGERLPQRCLSRSSLGGVSPWEGGVFRTEGPGGGEGDSLHSQNINHPQRESPTPQSHKQFPTGRRF